ncbi:extracellular solute-binding protein [Thauera sp. CAU 1555]|uniref:Extracellular solute-binding protein n=1 Tax=Thauera sedimentorum TaxID=2767595 RepID=A0ABR9B725_9RHOO|nr:extracellular solute-binding protein [Thauera sedimentorum]MBC9071250.1 extracellular solute-binding protein [Thauera sedimentorum]MBD8502169.1 extracellular solute-binding protein [Thauera sedimentorum]
MDTKRCPALHSYPLLRGLLSFAVAACCCLGGGAAYAESVLRVLSWPGYADDDLVEIFERRTGARVEITLVGSDDQLRAHLATRAGGDFDVVAANTAEIERFIADGLLQPIEAAHIPGIARQLPRFRDLQGLDGIVRDGKRHAVPYTYAEMGLIYDRQAFPAPPDTLAVLWNPLYRGRVLAYDGSTHAFSLAAIREDIDPFRIADADFPRLVRSLIELRRNVLAFYTLPEDSVELFRRHRAVLLFANYGTQQLKQLRDAGLNVGYAIPREGALAWLDCWAISRGARDVVLAERWIDFMLEPAASRALTERHGLGNTTEQDSAPAEDKRLIWLEPVEDDARRARLWQRIMAGDRPETF